MPAHARGGEAEWRGAGLHLLAVSACDDCCAEIAGDAEMVEDGARGEGWLVGADAHEPAAVVEFGEGGAH